MDIRPVAIVSCWVAVTIISAVYIWVGGVNIWNYTAVGLLVLTAFIITFGVIFALRPEKKREIALLSELTNMKSKLDELMKKVEEIKKAIEE